MYKVQLENFRCFKQTSEIEIRPITFLVGENSAGKTSFLAGLRFLLESFSRQSQNPFNRDPYYLGGFEQIAHYRGGSPGRAKKFSLSISTGARGKRGASSNLSDYSRHTFDFENGKPQPMLSNYNYIDPEGQIGVDLRSEKPSVNISIRNGRPQSPVKVNSPFPPSTFFRENVHFLFFMLDARRLERKYKNPASASDSGEETDAHRFDEIVTRFRRSGSLIDQSVFASSPVRTQPLRTYNPSEIVVTSEGSHVPLELARIKGDDPKIRWIKTREALEAFGKSAGLFSGIDVRRLGKSDIDPFQIMVKTTGPSMNLVDVGYGVSQALPIAYQIINAPRSRSFLIQQPEVHLHPMAQAEIGSLFSGLLKRHPDSLMVVETHSDYMIDRVRIEILQKKIKPESVTILWFTKNQHGSDVTNLYINSMGDLINTPAEFRSFFLQETAHLLGLN